MRGSGQSGGQFTTLGVKESSDVYQMIKTLQRVYDCQNMILYGRSMGAASIMKFIDEHKKGNHNLDSDLPRVQGVILDSPFYTIKKFFNNYVQKKYFFISDSTESNS
jgi:alpha-beta hydrolase superfamily lysophospholipase